MGLISAKCTQCGAALSVDESQEAAICEYCQMPFIVEKAIRQYNIESIHIHTDATSHARDFRILAGVLTEYQGAATEVIIPDGIVKIAPEVFAELDTITSVSIPEGVAIIGEKARSGHGTFRGCAGLKTVNIPDSVDFIMPGTFHGCTNLVEVLVSDEKLFSLGFYGIYDIFCYLPPTPPPCFDSLVMRVKQESKRRGVCWQCKATLSLKKNGKCRGCGSKGQM